MEKSDELVEAEEAFWAEADRVYYANAPQTGYTHLHELLQAVLDAFGHQSDDDPSGAN